MHYSQSMPLNVQPFFFSYYVKCKSNLKYRNRKSFLTLEFFADAVNYWLNMIVKKFKKLQKCFALFNHNLQFEVYGKNNNYLSSCN